MEKELLEKALNAGGQRTVHITPANISTALSFIKEEETAKGLTLGLLDDEGKERHLTGPEWEAYLAAHTVTEEEEEEAEAEEPETIVHNTMIPITEAVRAVPAELAEKAEEAGADDLCIVITDGEHIYKARDILDYMG